MKVKVLPTNCLIKLELSGEFYGRIQSLSLKMIEDYGNDNFENFLTKLKNNEGLTEEEQHLETMIILCTSIEKSAEEQNLFKEVEIEKKD